MVFKKKNNNKVLPHSTKSPTIIDENTHFEGKLSSSYDITIDGELNGELTSDRNIYITNNGSITADISTQCIFIYGHVKGNIIAQEKLHIGEEGRVEGDVKTKSLTVSTGGHLEGNCRMINGNTPLPKKDEAHVSTPTWDFPVGGNVKDMKQEKAKKSAL